jgi:hypothetical protein
MKINQYPKACAIFDVPKVSNPLKTFDDSY